MAASGADSPPPVRVIEDLRYRSHAGPEGHPERPERLIAVADAIDLFRPRIEIHAPRPATPKEILRVHEERLLDFLASTREIPAGQIDADTYFNPSSFDIACLAAGGAVELARSIMLGEARSGLAAIRPPGHHAEASRAMGFCLFNHIAVAARAIQAEFGTPRILILDWDVHHGNGTQHSFESDPSVLYVSTHQFPFYPGTGDFGEVGVGKGAGATLNIPMPAGCGDAEYQGVFERIIVPAALDFAPDLILVSCGFDAHRDDPLASMNVSGDGFAAMARIMRKLASELCGGRIAYVLEGGYALSGVREGTTAVLSSLVDAFDPELPEPIQTGPGDLLNGILARVRECHPHIRDIGAA